MTPDQINEAMRLASAYATQRAYRAGILRDASTAKDSVLVAQAHVRVKRAEAKLRHYLEAQGHMTRRLAGALSDVLNIDGDAGSADTYTRAQNTLDEYLTATKEPT